jgi:hypothetical protein
MFAKKMLALGISVLGVVFAASICFGSGDLTWPGCCYEDVSGTPACSDCDDFTKEFRLQDCWWFQTVGINPYFKLIPGYRLVLEGQEEDETIRAEVTVLWDIEWIYVPGIGWVRTRVVEEREWVEDKLIEVSRNFFAICKKSNSVYYFGEDVYVCDSGLVSDGDGFVCQNSGEEVSREGEWRAGEDGAMPGLIMPGTFLLGAKYCQEQKPVEPGGDQEEAAVDRGENLEMALDWPEELGPNEEPMFTGCVKVLDTNPSDEPPTCGEVVEDERNGDIKIYCPGVGLVQDEELKLVCYGFHCDD